MAGHLSQIRLDSYKPLRELVCEHIREAIINGVFAPGERLMEIQMADEMGVSRTPVREAIRKLEMEGFVVMIPRRGTYVSNMSIKDINDVYEIRTSLDILAAGLAAERINDDELEELQRLLVQVGHAIDSGDMEKVLEADIAFHDVLYKASRNERLRISGKHRCPGCGKKPGSGAHPFGKCRKNLNGSHGRAKEPRQDEEDDADPSAGRGGAMKDCDDV